MSDREFYWDWLKHADHLFAQRSIYFVLGETVLLAALASLLTGSPAPAWESLATRAVTCLFYVGVGVSAVWCGVATTYAFVTRPYIDKQLSEAGEFRWTEFRDHLRQPRNFFVSPMNPLLAMVSVGFLVVWVLLAWYSLGVILFAIGGLMAPPILTRIVRRFVYRDAGSDKGLRVRPGLRDSLRAGGYVRTSRRACTPASRADGRFYWDWLKHEDNQFDARANYFLLAQSMMLVAAATLWPVGTNERNQWPTLGVAVAGVALCLLWLFVARRWFKTTSAWVSARASRTEIRWGQLMKMRRGVRVISMGNNQVIGYGIPGIIVLLWAVLIVLLCLPQSPKIEAVGDSNQGSAADPR